MKNRSLCVAVVLFTSLFSCREKEEWVQPVWAPITEAVFASGHIEPLYQTLLTSTTEGYLQRVLAQENEVVAAQQNLFVLDNQTTDTEVQAAKENLDIATYNISAQSPVLQKLWSDLDAAMRKLSLDSTQYERKRLLFQTQSVSQVDMEYARLQWEVDRATVKSIRDNLEATRLALNQALIQARSQYHNALTGNQYYKLKSQQRARLYRIFKKQGELVRRGETVAIMGHPDSLLVMLSVDEASVAKVSNGQTVLVELNTDKGNVYEARITKIYPYFDHETQAFKAEAMFVNAPTNLIAGTLVQANVIVSQKQRALLLPRACLSPDGEVTSKTNEGITSHKIKTGIISTEWVEVLEGMDTTTHVLKF